MPVDELLAVDTNVPMVANGDSPQASRACVIACQDRLLQIVTGRSRLLLDDGFEIYREYLGRLSLGGQPGVGDAFAKWVHDNQFNANRCERVRLNHHETRGYEEFPDDPELCDFDLDDRKFAAVVRASRKGGAVLNAVDSDWWVFQVVLALNGIAVRFACADQVSAWRRNLQRREATDRA